MNKPTDKNAYGTPGPYLDLVREALGYIDLDPASNARANETVQARRFYTEQEDGLRQSWEAPTLFLNPPYSRDLVPQFCFRFITSYKMGDFKAGIMLVNACTETGWFQQLLGFCVVCFPDRRISFLNDEALPVKGNAYRQAFFYAGPDPHHFRKVFSSVGVCLRAR